MSSPTPDPARGEEVVALDRKHVFHSWSAQGALNPMRVAGAEGSYVWDYDGNRYLDFSSQLVNTNIGHQHPKVVAAIQQQAAHQGWSARAVHRVLRVAQTIADLAQAEEIELSHVMQAMYFRMALQP